MLILTILSTKVGVKVKKIEVELKSIRRCYWLPTVDWKWADLLKFQHLVNLNPRFTKRKRLT